MQVYDKNPVPFGVPVLYRPYSFRPTSQAAGTIGASIAAVRLLMSSFEQFIACLVLVGLSTALLSFFLPRPLFCKMFKIAFPFVAEQLSDRDRRDN
jgi:hypothetical protein